MDDYNNKPLSQKQQQILDKLETIQETLDYKTKQLHSISYHINEFGDSLNACASKLEQMAETEIDNSGYDGWLK